MLCDAATVREQLLHVLGAGISVVTRQSYPAPLGASLALMFECQEDATEVEIGFSVRIRQDSPNNRAIATFDVQFDFKKDVEESPIQVPLAIPLHEIGIPEPGIYTLSVVRNGWQDENLRFTARVLTDD